MSAHLQANFNIKPKFMINKKQSIKREKLVIANFKANVISNQKQYVDTLLELVSRGAEGVGASNNAENEGESIGDSSVLCVVCPSTPYISSFNEYISAGLADNNGDGAVSVVCGAQSVSSALQGSYTGEVVAEMLADVGTKFAIVGHSEERAMLKRENDDIASAVKNCFTCGLGVVLCVSNETISSLREIVSNALKLLAKHDKSPSLNELNLVIAYEPIDAINGASAAPADIRKKFFNEIKSQIDSLSVEFGESGEEFCNSIRLIYGGSADEITAKKIVEEDGIDGVIVGRATLDPIKIAKICRSLV